MHLYSNLPLLALGFSTLANAFVRTAPDIYPLDTDYVKTSLLNVSKSLLSPGEAINSYWTIFWLSLENGHDVFIVGQVQITNLPIAGAVSTTSRASICDITAGTYVSTANTTNGIEKSPVTNIDITLPEYRTVYNPDDNFSWQVSTSTAAGVEFNLTSVPKGNLLVDGGSGTFLWGSNWTTEWASPEQWVTGTVRLNGTDVAVIPEKSMSWLDRQFGPGFGTSGWNLFIGHLSNGVKFCVWHANDIIDGIGSRQRFATLAFADGHEEVYPVGEDFQKLNPWVSTETNVTYYGNYVFSIPLKNITLAVTLPVLAGEIVNHKSPTADEALFEGYSTFEGNFGCEYVTGWGVSEVKAPFSVQI